VFEYDDANFADSFSKSRLAAVALRSDPVRAGTELYRHTFDYEKAPPLDGMFASESDWATFRRETARSGRTTDWRTRRTSSTARRVRSVSGLRTFSHSASEGAPIAARRRRIWRSSMPTATACRTRWSRAATSA
jgi:hypothetical protein